VSAISVRKTQMISKPEVSVVIPTFNEEKQLPNLLQCIQRQSYRVLEVIVADNESADRTPAICEDYGVELTRGGLPGTGRNAGARRAKGDYLLFLDADTEFAPDFVSSLVAEVMERRLDAASCRCNPLSNDKLLKCIYGFANRYFWLTTRLGFPHSIGACLFVKKAAHDAIGGFDETIKVAEDQDYVRRLMRSGRYEFLFKPVIDTSVRRFAQEGYARLCLKWVWIDLHRAILGEIRKEGLVKYF